jgi:hypothetical protein
LTSIYLDIIEQSGNLGRETARNISAGTSDLRLPRRRRSFALTVIQSSIMATTTAPDTALISPFLTPEDGLKRWPRVKEI